MYNLPSCTKPQTPHGQNNSDAGTYRTTFLNITGGSFFQEYGILGCNAMYFEERTTFRRRALLARLLLDGFLFGLSIELEDEGDRFPQCFGGQHASCWVYSSVQKMEAACSSDVSEASTFLPGFLIGLFFDI
jgi:hypothetical protein